MNSVSIGNMRIRPIHVLKQLFSLESDSFLWALYLLNTLLYACGRKKDIDH